MFKFYWIPIEDDVTIHSFLIVKFLEKMYPNVEEGKKVIRQATFDCLDELEKTHKDLSYRDYDLLSIETYKRLYKILMEKGRELNNE